MRDFIKELNHNNPLRRDIIRTLIHFFQEQGVEVDIKKLAETLGLCTRTIQRAGIETDRIPIFQQIQGTTGIKISRIIDKEKKKFKDYGENTVLIFQVIILWYGMENMKMKLIQR